MIGYESAGQGNALVFLHGALVDRRMWRAQADAFSDRYRVVCVDLPGHGESAGMPVQSVKAMAETVIALLDSLSIDRFLLCGHSLGGMVAQEITLRYPGRVRGLILAESSFGTASSLAERLGTASTRMMLRLMTQKQLVRLSATSYGKLHPAVKAYIEAAMGAYDIQTSRAVMGAALEYSSRDGLGDIRCPVLILAAACNRQTHRQARQFTKLIHGAEMEMIPNALHLLNLDQPAAFNETVARFLGKHELT
ncbi:MAG TPA: alpha/beta fold hydrolase [Candidatus Limiplasma sp.]|nr:alpha/beta fold hydrolase [Candidatus Limiplasma sp.]HRX09125.1 alpha/beta fold hydrolase [Candidatus Limiplasma sp.]